MQTNPYKQAAHAVRYFLLRRLPACKEMVALMSQSLERPLTLRERALLKLHLWVCAWCVFYLEQLRLMRASRRATKAGGDYPGAPLSADARERIKSALGRERS